jgi:hypothetical protein
MATLNRGDIPETTTIPKPVTTENTLKPIGKLVFELNDNANSQISKIGAALGLSESLLAQGMQGAKNAGREGYNLVLPGTNQARIALSNGTGVTPAMVSRFKFIQQAGKVFVVLDIASNSIDAVKGLATGNTAKAISGTIKVGLTVGTTAITAANPVVGTVLSTGIFFYDTVGMAEGESRIEKNVEALLKMKSEDLIIPVYTASNRITEQSLTAKVSSTVNSNFSNQNQKTGNISTLTTNSETTQILGAARYGADIYTSCLDSKGVIDKEKFNRLRTNIMSGFQGDKIRSALNQFGGSSQLTAFTINFDKGVALAKRQADKGSTNLQTRINNSIISEAQEGKIFRSPNKGSDNTVRVNASNGYKILPIGVAEAKKQQQTNKPKPKVQVKVK